MWKPSVRILHSLDFCFGWFPWYGSFNVKPHWMTPSPFIFSPLKSLKSDCKGKVSLVNGRVKRHTNVKYIEYGSFNAINAIWKDAGGTVEGQCWVSGPLLSVCLQVHSLSTVEGSGMLTCLPGFGWGFTWSMCLVFNSGCFCHAFHHAYGSPSAEVCLNVFLCIMWATCVIYPVP